jgi:hypothetical protein
VPECAGGLLTVSNQELGGGRASPLRAGGSAVWGALTIGPTHRMGERGRRARHSTETADRNARTRADGPQNEAGGGPAHQAPGPASPAGRESS